MLKNMKSSFLGTLSSIAIGLGVLTFTLCGVALVAAEADRYWFSGSITSSLLTVAENALEEAGPIYTAVAEVSESYAYSYDFDAPQAVAETIPLSEFEELEEIQQLMETEMEEAHSRMEIAIESARPHFDEASRSVQSRVQSQMDRMEERLDRMTEKLQERMDRISERTR